MKVDTFICPFLCVEYWSNKKGEKWWIWVIVNFHKIKKKIKYMFKNKFWQFRSFSCNKIPYNYVIYYLSSFRRKSGCYLLPPSIKFYFSCEFSVSALWNYSWGTWSTCNLYKNRHTAFLFSRKRKVHCY